MSAILAVPMPIEVMAMAGPGARTVADRPSASTSRDQPCPTASMWCGRPLWRLSVMSLPILRTGLACALVHVTGLGCSTSHCHSGAGARSKTTFRWGRSAAALDLSTWGQPSAGAREIA